MTGPDTHRPAPNLKEDFNPKSIAYECLRILTGDNGSSRNSETAFISKDVHRVVARLELVSSEDPAKIEEILQSLLPAPEWEELRARLGKLALKTCLSREPKCESCLLNSLCPSSCA